MRPKSDFVKILLAMMILSVVFVSLGHHFVIAGQIYAYPVPWIPYDAKEETGDTNGITFTGIDPPSTIRIYNSRGDEVHKIEALEEDMVWDVVENKGAISSGVYIYLVEKNGINIKTGKLIIIW